MPSARAILTTVPRQSLRALVAHFDLQAKDGRKIDDLVAALLKAKDVSLADALTRLAAGELRTLCQSHNVVPEKNNKAAYVAALSAQAAPKKAGKAAPAKASKAAAAAPNKSAVAKAKPAKAAKAAPAKASKAAKTTTKAKAAKASRTAALPATQAPAMAGGATKASKAAKLADPNKADASAAPGPSMATKPSRARKAASAEAPAAKSDKGGKKAAAPVSKHAPASAPRVVAAQAPDADEPQLSALPPAKPAVPQPVVRKKVLSWSEAAEAAAKRGQSAASMLGEPMAWPSKNPSAKCKKCREAYELQSCQIHSCAHQFVASAGRKICAECMFERNNMSVTAFHERLEEDWQCPHCQTQVGKPPAPSPTA